MTWAMLLFSMREAAEDDAHSAKRRAERKAEKQRIASETDVEASIAKESGGILGTNLDELAGKNDLGDQFNVSFRRLADTNASWLTMAIQDATEYAIAHTPRSKNAVDRAHQSNASNSAPQSLETLFVSNLWPSLKCRGWTAEVIVDGQFSGTTCYSHSGKEVGRS